MADPEKIQKFLSAMAYEASTLRRETLAREVNPFVTISREAGAGGHSLAEIILEKMQAHARFPIFQGWQILDAELCKKILADRNLKVSFEALLSEEYHSEIEDIMNNLIVGYAPQSQVNVEIFSGIRKLATLGKVIVVGRGGACLTRELRHGVHVRLVAPRPSRIRRMMERLKVTENEARKIVARRDSARTKLLKTYFSKDIRDPLLYDVTWNTDSVTLEEIASSSSR